MITTGKPYVRNIYTGSGQSFISSVEIGKDYIIGQANFILALMKNQKFGLFSQYSDVITDNNRYVLKGNNNVGMTFSKISSCLFHKKINIYLTSNNNNTLQLSELLQCAQVIATPSIKSFMVLCNVNIEQLVSTEKFTMSLPVMFKLTNVIDAFSIGVVVKDLIVCSPMVVGKIFHVMGVPQDEINDLIIKYQKSYKTIFNNCFNEDIKIEKKNE